MSRPSTGSLPNTANRGDKSFPVRLQGVHELAKERRRPTVDRHSFAADPLGHAGQALVAQVPRA